MDKVILFTQYSLHKSADILKIRKKNNLHGKDIQLPTSLNNLQGYHSNCLSRFTAVQKNINQLVQMNLLRQQVHYCLSLRHQHLQQQSKWSNEHHF